jgi:hypothetical protein
MDIDLNRVCGQDDDVEIDEVNLYRYFEDVYRANERISDDVGMREISNDLDLNIEYVKYYRITYLCCYHLRG